MGLPDTPDVVEHLHARAADTQEPLPARGVLVTTRVYLDWDGTRREWVMDGSPDFTITGSSGWTSKEIHARAYAVAKVHSEWLTHWAVNGLTIDTARRSAQQHSFAREPHRRSRGETDYRTAALDPALLESMENWAPNHDRDSWGGVIREQIKHVEDRVTAARKGNRLPGSTWVPEATITYWEIHTKAHAAKNRSE